MSEQVLRWNIYTTADPTVERIIPKLAAEIGLNESIVLLQIAFWINSSNNVRDGKYWTYQSLREMREKAFPFWGIETIRRIVKHLSDKGYIIIGNYNKREGDTTQWFALEPDKLSSLKSVVVMPSDEKPVSKWDTLSQSDRGMSQNETTLPENTTETTSEIKKEIPPTPPKKGKREKIIDPDTIKENEQIAVTIEAYIRGLSSIPATNQYGNKTTRRAALDVAKAGYTPEQVETYTRHVQCQDYWRGKKPPFSHIAEGIAAYYAAHKPKPIFEIPEGHYNPALDDGTPATPEQIQQAKAVWTKLVESKSGNTQVKQHAE